MSNDAPVPCLDTIPSEAIKRVADALSVVFPPTLAQNRRADDLDPSKERQRAWDGGARSVVEHLYEHLRVRAENKTPEPEDES